MLSAASWWPIEVQFEYRHGAVFFCGVSESRLNIGISALLFFVPNKSENHAHISGGSLLYQVRLVQLM
jgi:hypothetical protein